MQSERIKEFLKYASPRLDYIEQCMEKQAVGKLIKAFKTVRKGAAPINRIMNPVRNMKSSKGKSAKGMSDAQILKDPKLNRSAQLEALKGMYDAGAGGMSPAEAIASLKSLGYTDTQAVRILRRRMESALKEDLRSGRFRQVHDNNTPALPALPAGVDGGVLTKTDLRLHRGMSPIGNTSRIDGLSPVEFSKYRRDASKRRQDRIKELTGSANPKSKNAPKSNATGWWNDATKNVSDWVGKHPAITSALTGVGGGALGGGIGYGIGSGSGQQDGFDAASAYYKMREALQRHNLMSANDNILSRLANVFGGGDLSNLIG